MNEPNTHTTNDPPSSTFPGNTSESSDTVRPLSADLASEGMDFIEEPKKSVPTQLILLVVLFAVAGAALYGMRTVGLAPVKAFAEDVKVQYDPFKRAKDTKHREILQDLSAGTTSVQVPPNKVQKNPFKLSDSIYGNEADSDSKNGLEAQRLAREREKERREAQRREQKIQSTLERLEVHSIIGGSVPIARINGEIYRVGDKIENLFTVVEIEGRNVVLQIDDKKHVISMINPIAQEDENDPWR